ncbi:tape measure protein [Enterococcus sp. DIV0800]|uniref:tape measure protein n=1 Tax=unclassified Enterococcus TaxID=2608891 RepID=UPI003D2FF569
MAVEKISVEVKSNAKKIEKELDGIDERIKKLKNSKASIELRAEKLKNAKDEISKIELQLKQLAAKKASIKADASNIKDAKAKVEDLNQQMAKLRERKAHLQVTTTELKGADKELNNLNKEMTRLNNRKARLQLDQMDIQESESKIGKLKTKLSELGNTKTKIDISSNIHELGSKLDNIGSKILNPFASKINQVIGIGALLKGVDAAVSMVSSSVGGAIDRYDIVQNYPTIMSNMNISAKDAEASINALKDGLTGLPTTLDDSILSVQRFTSKNKDIKKSTNQFLALNNAILAGKASTEIQASAMEQFSQAYSKGKMDMMEWRTMQMAMPAQIDQVAQAFNISADALGDGLRDGTISMEQFMNKVEEMNKQGVNGFKSFEEQAKNAVSGLRTGMAVMKSAVTRGVESIIGTLDTMLEKAGFGGFAGVMGAIGSTFENNFKKIAAFIDQNQDKITDFFKKIKDAFEAFDKKEFFAGLKDSFDDVIGSGKEFMTFAKPFVDFFKQMIEKLGDGNFERGLGRLPGKILKFGIAAKIAGKGLKLFSGPLSKLIGNKLFGGLGGGSATTFEGFKGNMFDGLASLGKKAGNMALVFAAIKLIEQAAEAIKQVDQKVPDDFSGMVKKLGLMGVAIAEIGALAFIASKIPMKDGFTGLAMIAGISLNIMVAAEALNQVNRKVSSDMDSMADKLRNMGIALVGMGALVTAAGLLATMNPVAAVAGLVAVAAIAGELILTAEALHQIDTKVSGDLSNIGKKLANIGIAIGAMGVLAAAVGAFVATGIGAVLLGGGLITIAAIAKELIVVSDALQQVDQKVPSDFSSLKGKIKSIVSVVKYMTRADLGGLLSTFENIFKGFNVKAVSDVLKKLADVGAILDQMPTINGKKALNSVRQIKLVVDSMGGASDFVERIKNFAKSVINSSEVEAVKKYMSSLKSIAQNLTAINGGEIDLAATKKRLQEILSVIGLLGDKKFNKKLSNAGESSKFSSVKKSIGHLKEIMDILHGLSGHLDIVPIQTNIDLLKNVIKSLGNKELFQDYGMGKNQGSKPFASMKKTIGYLLEIAGMLSQLTYGIDFNSAQGNINGIKGIIQSLNMNEIFANYSMKKNQGSKPFASMKKTIAHIQEIAGMLSQLTYGIDFTAAQANVNGIKGVIQSLNMNEIFANYGMGKNEGSKPFASMKKTVGYLLELAGMLSQLTYAIDFGAAQANINGIKGVIMSLNMNEIFANYGMGKNEGSKPFASMKKTFTYLLELGGMISQLTYGIDFVSAQANINGIKSLIQSLNMDEIFANYGMGKSEGSKPFASMVKTFGHLITLGQKVNELSFNITFEPARVNIHGIKEILALLGSEEMKSTYENMLKEGKWNNSIKVIDAVIRLRNKINELPANPINKEAAIAEIQKVKDVLNELANFPAAKGVESIDGLVAAFENLINRLNSLSGKFQPVGLNYGKEVIKGFNKANIPGKFVNVINKAITSLNNKASAFTAIGERYGQALCRGFANSVADNMDRTIHGQLMSLNNQASSFGIVGSNYGTMLASSFSAQIQNLASNVGNQIQLIQLAMDNLRAPTLTPRIMTVSSSSGSSSSGAAFLNRGGAVSTQYLADGGTPFVPKGKDTIPAMLSPGEFVQRKAAHQKFGSDFMERVNNLDIQGVFRSLTGRFNLARQMQPAVSTVVNNISHTSNNNAKLNQYFSGKGDQGSGFKRANRYIRSLGR